MQLATHPLHVGAKYAQGLNHELYETSSCAVLEYEVVANNDLHFDIM